MFEEIAVWARESADVAIRYAGFRNLESNQVWIAFANYIGGDEQLGADALVAPQAMLEYFLNELPTEPDQWMPTLSAAVAYFLEKNPDR